MPSLHSSDLACNMFLIAEVLRKVFSVLIGAAAVCPETQRTIYDANRPQYDLVTHPQGSRPRDIYMGEGNLGVGGGFCQGWGSNCQPSSHRHVDLGC